MIAPVIHQKPITLFFSPLASTTSANNITTTSTITTTAKTAKTAISVASNRLALKPALVASRRHRGSSMTQKNRHLAFSRDTRTNSLGSEGRSIVEKKQVNGVEPPPKRLKVESIVNKRVGGPVRNSDHEESRAKELRVVEKSVKSKDLGKPEDEQNLASNGHVNGHGAVSPQTSELDTEQTLGNLSVPEKEISTSNSEKKDDNKRSLRSHDGQHRSKSELAQYFPNFEEVVNPDVKEKEYLAPKTRLFITEETLKNAGEPQFVLSTPIRTRAPSLTIPVQTKHVQNHTFEKIELPSVDVTIGDPLADSYYEVAHRRAERQEKQLRNIERERAQHEKVQLERLYEGLLGPDWLKVMGISGVTEGDRKKWDDARDYFIKEVKSLLNKFARWKDEERRRKLVEIRKRREAEEEESNEETEEEEEEQSSSPESSPDAAAQQLQSETLALVNHKTKPVRVRKPSKRALDASPPPTPSKKRPPKVRPLLLPQPPPIPTGPFTSFFAKPHQRAAALDKNRRTGRTRWALGHPIPELLEQEFSLPQDMISLEARKASARMRRGVRRSRD